jgi:hypothetical protein
VTPPPPEPQLVTFQGRAFLDGQPEPVNALHLPLHYDIQIVSYMLGDSASYDTVYTDSSGVYTSTKLRLDGTYTIISQYPYYRTDTMQIQVKNGMLVSNIPDLHSRRLLKMEVFADSTVYHSLLSDMLFEEVITNLNCDTTDWLFPCDSLTAPNTGRGAVAAPVDFTEFIVRTDDVFNRFMVVHPNITFLGCLPACYVHRTGIVRDLINFYDHVRQKSPESGTYYLYVKGQSWSAYGAWYPHYRSTIHWWFKVVEPTVIEIELE